MVQNVGIGFQIRHLTCPKCGYQISNRAFFSQKQKVAFTINEYGTNISYYTLFSIILSEYDIPEEDLPIIGIITITVLEY